MGKRSSLRSYKKNKTNPFMEEALQEIENKTVKKYRNSAGTSQTAILQAIDNEGNAVGHTSFIRRIEVDEDQFSKIYLRQFRAFWDIGPEAIRVFDYIMQQMRIGQDRFPFIMDEALDYTEYKDAKSVRIGLTNLLEKGIIARGPTDTLYYINPMIIFNGNRVTFAQEFVKKKKKASDPNQIAMFSDNQRSVEDQDYEELE